MAYFKPHTTCPTCSAVIIFKFVFKNDFAVFLEMYADIIHDNIMRILVKYEVHIAIMSYIKQCVSM